MKALGISATRRSRGGGGGGAVRRGHGRLDGAGPAVFVGMFIFLPSAGTKGIDALIGNVMGDGIWFHLVESVVRIVIFLAYLWSISLISDIRRVFQYHGAEHKTIAAWEHGEVLEPENVDRYSTLHVRCGTNFLILVMLLAVVIYTAGGLLVPPPEGIAWWGVRSLPRGAAHRAAAGRRRRWPTRGCGSGASVGRQPAGARPS
jgi:small-conductance mechanosensitive channel